MAKDAKELTLDQQAEAYAKEQRAKEAAEAEKAAKASAEKAAADAVTKEAQQAENDAKASAEKERIAKLKATVKGTAKIEAPLGDPSVAGHIPGTVQVRATGKAHAGLVKLTTGLRAKGATLDSGAAVDCPALAIAWVLESIGDA